MLSNTHEPLLTPRQSEWRGISTRNLCIGRNVGEIPAMKVGRQWRFRKSELASLLKDPAQTR